MLPMWLTVQNGERFSIELLSGETLLILLNATSDSGVGAASLLTDLELEQLLQNPIATKAWLDESGHFQGSSTFRIIGKVDLRLRDFLLSLGLTEGKSLNIPSGQETHLLWIPFEGRLRMLKDSNGKESPPSVPQVEIKPTFTKKIENRKIRVLVIDDSETIRKLLSRMISEDPDLEFVGGVGASHLAPDAIEALKPDVITLDIHMPGKDGVELLREIHPKYGIPTIMVSALSKDEGTFVLDALEIGAVDYVQKPSFSEVATMAPIIREKIKAAAQVSLNKKGGSLTVHSKLANLDLQQIDLSTLIAVGSSTGGTEALKTVLMGFPKKIPPVLIVQHIPAVFSKAFAERMQQLCPFEVKEAEDGDLVTANRVLVAPGGQQMEVRNLGSELRIRVFPGGKEHLHNPSVDVLFQSLLSTNVKKIAAAILTGMGTDGAKGMLALKEKGAATFAQNEETCVVFGMPREALKIGASDKAVPIEQIAEELILSCRYQRMGQAGILAG